METERDAGAEDAADELRRDLVLVERVPVLVHHGEERIDVRLAVVGRDPHVVHTDGRGKGMDRAILPPALPVEADKRCARAKLIRLQQRRNRMRHTGQHRLGPLVLRAFRFRQLPLLFRFQFVPAAQHVLGAVRAVLAENVWMPPHHLGVDALDNVVNRELPYLARHPVGAVPDSAAQHDADSDPQSHEQQRRPCRQQVSQCYKDAPHDQGAQHGVLGTDVPCDPPDDERTAERSGHGGPFAPDAPREPGREDRFQRKDERGLERGHMPLGGHLGQETRQRGQDRQEDRDPDRLGRADRQHERADHISGRIADHAGRAGYALRSLINGLGETDLADVVDDSCQGDWIDHGTPR